LNEERRTIKMENHLDFQLIQPDSSIRDFVYCFSSLKNFCNEHDAVVIPNGKVDLIFSLSKDNRLQTVLLGLESQPKYPDQDVNDFFSVSLHPVAVEYILGFPIADILNSGKLMPDHFWDFHPDDLNDFGGFCSKVTQKIHSLLQEKADPRKLKLFKLISDFNGEISVGELSEQVLWSPREINRYFNKQFGLSVKAYCKILRFQASLEHIREGELYPQLNFTDQSHFIKEIKKLSGVSPKELHKNDNGRFLQFLALGRK